MPLTLTSPHPNHHQHEMDHKCSHTCHYLNCKNVFVPMLFYRSHGYITVQRCFINMNILIDMNITYTMQIQQEMTDLDNGIKRIYIHKTEV
jgi:hypothetical protein